MPLRKNNKSMEDEIDLLSSEFITSTTSRRGKKTTANNTNRHSSMQHRSILEDLEAQSPSFGVDLAPPRAWRPNSLCDEGTEVAEAESCGLVTGCEGTEVGLDEVEQVLQVSNNNNNSGNDISSDNSEGGQQQPIEKENRCGNKTVQFLKKHHVNMLIILLLLSGAIAATLKFGVPSAQRTINAGNKDDAVEVDPTNSPTLPPVDDVNETFIETPTSFPTVWETYHPSILWPTYSPTLTPSYPTADYDDGGNFSTAIVEDDHLDDNATAATIDDLLVGGNNNSITDDFFVFEGINSLATNATNETTTSTDDELETELIATTSSTVDAAAAATTVDGSSFASSTISSSEPTLPSSTSTTTDAATTVTTEITTTEATAAAATTTAATTATTASPHICIDTSSGGKMFSISITPTSSTTSLELLRQDDISGEYIMVTTYPTSARLIQ